MQMGEIPMLSRREEMAVLGASASRRGFRCCMLATDYILQAAIGLLEDIRDNKLRLDRTIDVSVINVGEKARLLKVLPPNLRTLRHLMLQNKRDFALAINRRQPAKRRRAGLAAAADPPRQGGPAGRGNGAPHAAFAAVVGRNSGRFPSGWTRFGGNWRRRAATRRTSPAPRNSARNCAI